jgi:hypothetical protein
MPKHRIARRNAPRRGAYTLKYKGVTIDVFASSISSEATAEAPDGTVFAVTKVHQAVCGTNGNNPTACIGKIKNDIDGGFVRCADPDCEYCFS